MKFRSPKSRISKRAQVLRVGQGLIALALGLPGCGKDSPQPMPPSQDNINKRQSSDAISDPDLEDTPSGDQKPEDKNEPTQDPPEPGAALTEIEAFKRTAYPVLTQYCGSCHAASAAPLFSQADTESAMIAVTDTGKVNFTAIERSRLYLRLATDNHNCWSDCTSNAQTMKDAIDAWLALLLQLNPNFLSEFESSLVTTELLLKDAEQRMPTPDAQSVILEAETATLTAPMRATMDPLASGGSFIEVPEGTGGGSITNPNQNGVGTSVFNVTIPTAGTYKVWAQVSATTDANNAFFIRMDANPFQNWEVPLTAGKWEWTQANQQDGRAELSFNLTAGAHTLEIKRRDVATKLDRVAITMNPAFDGTQAETKPIQVLRYDISTISGKPNTFFEIEVTDFSEAAFKFRKPTIISEQPLTVKGLRILINGHENPQHNTYNLIDAAVTPPRTQLSRAAMVVLKEQGNDLDKISFSFEALQ